MKNQKLLLVITPFLAICLGLGGCKSTSQDAHSNSGIGYLSGKYRVCEDPGNCPSLTPKEMDEDTQRQLASDLENRIAQNMQNLAANNADGAGGLNTEGASTSITDQSSKETDKNRMEISFDFAQSIPNAAGNKSLFNLLALLTQSPSVLQLEIVGKTDSIGTKKFNLRLATKRAKYVADWLQAKKISGSIVQSSTPECCLKPPYDKQNEQLVLQRKVVVILKTTGKGQEMDK